MINNTIEKIIDSVNISEIMGKYVDLIKKGKNNWAICPFHDDNNPSMSISDEKKIYKCFVCGAGGNVITFLSEYENIPFSQAVIKLAKQLNIEINKKYDLKPKYNEIQQKLINVLNDANNFFQYSLFEKDGEKAYKYLQKRNIDKNDIEKYKIGFAPQDGLIDFLKLKGHNLDTILNASLLNEYKTSFFQNRIMYAITNNFGDIVGFSGRAIGNNSPKYINSIDSLIFNKSSLLYNYYNAQNSIKKNKEIIITEGFMDVIAINKCNYPNVVAIMGTALTQKHIPILKNNKILFMLDDDKAGIEATIKSIKLLNWNNIKSKVISNNTNKDPDDILKIFGKDKLKEVLLNQIECFDFLYKELQKKIKPNTIQKKELFIKEYTNFFINASNLEKEYYAKKIASEYNFSYQTIINYFPKKTLKTIFEVKKIKNKEKNLKPPPNFVYKLFRSMAHNADFIRIFEKSNIYLENKTLTLIGAYMIKKLSNKNLKLDPILKEEIDKIKSEGSDYVKTKNEFHDLIEIIKKQEKNFINSNINVKLSNALNENEKIKQLEIKRKNMQKKK